MGDKIETFEDWHRELGKLLEDNSFPYALGVLENIEDYLKKLKGSYDKLKDSYHSELMKFYEDELSLTNSPLIVKKPVNKPFAQLVKDSSSPFDQCIGTLRDINKDDKKKAITSHKQMKTLYDSLDGHDLAIRRKFICQNGVGSGQTNTP